VFARDRLEGWKEIRCALPSFETRAFGALLRMTPSLFHISMSIATSRLGAEWVRAPEEM